jgi:hypothetical protein
VFTPWEITYNITCREAVNLTDIRKFEDTERPEKEIEQATEAADLKLRSLERTKNKTEPPSDVNYTDKAGRPMTIRTWESGNQAYVRAYDTSKVQVPDGINTGQAGYANATLERTPDNQARLRLNDIVISPDYRNAGNGGETLKQVEGFAKKNNAREIYGSIDSQEAQDFWKSQADKGWTIDFNNGSFYGNIHKTFR